MCLRRMIYWAIISFRPLLSECGQQRSQLNYICRVLWMSFLSRIHNFPVTHEAALLSFCTTNVTFTLPFSAHTRSPLTEDGLLHQVTKIIASTPCMFIPSPGFFLLLPSFLHADSTLDYLLPRTSNPSCVPPAFLPSPPAILSQFPHPPHGKYATKNKHFWALLP